MSLAIGDLLPLPPQALDFVEQGQHCLRVEGGDVERDRIGFFSRTVVSLLHADCDLVGSLFNAISVAVVRECVDDPSIALPRPRRRHLRDPTQLCQSLRRQLTHSPCPPLSPFLVWECFSASIALRYAL